jgi:hypothetical protein
MGRKKKDPEEVSRARREVANRRWGKTEPKAFAPTAEQFIRSAPEKAVHTGGVPSPKHYAKISRLLGSCVKEIREWTEEDQRKLAEMSRAAFADKPEDIAIPERTLFRWRICEPARGDDRRSDKAARAVYGHRSVLQCEQCGRDVDPDQTEAHDRYFHPERLAN